MRTLAIAAACAVLGGAAFTSALPAAAQDPTYQVRGYAGKCADAGSSTALRAKVQIRTCNGSAAQQWSFSAGELHHGGLCLNAKGGARNGAPVILWTCNGAANENWIYSTGGDRYFLRASGLCLDDPGFSSRNGTQLVVWRCNGGANQRWAPPPFTPPPPVPHPAGCYPLTSAGSCYEPGELCPAADHGMTGVAGNGEPIVCEDNDGWRWDPA